MNKYGLNPDIKRRDEILFGKYDPSAYMGGICRFEDMDLPTLKLLVDEGFVNLDERQNYSPSILELMEFSENYGGVYHFDGYVVSDRRDDYRVSIDGIARISPILDRDELRAFSDLAHDADEFDSVDGRAWWD